MDDDTLELAIPTDNSKAYVKTWANPPNSFGAGLGIEKSLYIANEVDAHDDAV